MTGRVAPVLGVLLLAAALSACAAPSDDDDGVPRTASPVHPTAATSSPAGAPAGAAPHTPPDLAVGALFPDGTDQPHGCTATVVDSPGEDVVMTAAHCISGHGAGWVFVPGYDRGRLPVGSFAVTGAYAPAGWLADQAEDDDVAFLTVAPRSDGTPVQSLTGAVHLSSTGAVDGEVVTLTAYDDGIDDSPVRCTTTVRDTEHQPTIDCHGFTAGSSGSAWIADEHGTPTAVGLIGGLHQGGCQEYTSYSPPLGADAAAALAVAGRGQPSDDLPDPPDDGC